MAGAAKGGDASGIMAQEFSTLRAIINGLAAMVRPPAPPAGPALPAPQPPPGPPGPAPGSAHGGAVNGDGEDPDGEHLQALFSNHPDFFADKMNPYPGSEP
jgi:hypothetical protein